MPNDIAELFTAPRDFLKMNLLLMLGKPPTVKGIYNFTFEDMTEELNWTCSRRSKHWWKFDYNIHIWAVRWDESGRNGSAAFFLPYKADDLKRGTLPATAPLMLTAAMTGCTFGVARFNNRQIDVCHANYQTPEGRLDDGRLLRETAFCTSRFSDRDYRQQIKGSAVADVARQSVLGATIIGTNHPRQGWKIYAQQWENLNGTNHNYWDLIEL
jgi:hypothetical protein